MSESIVVSDKHREALKNAIKAYEKSIFDFCAEDNPEDEEDHKMMHEEALDAGARILAKHFPTPEAAWSGIEVVHVWGATGEGGLYINGKKISDYYTVGQSDTVEALGFTPETRKLDDGWYSDVIRLPEFLSECVLDKNQPKPQCGGSEGAA